MAITRKFKENNALEIILAKEFGLSVMHFRSRLKKGQFSSEEKQHIEYMQKALGFSKRPNVDRRKLLIRNQVIRAEELIAFRLPKLLEKSFELVEGVTVQTTNDKGETKVYERPPDKDMLKYLLDRGMGPVGKTKFIEEENQHTDKAPSVKIVIMPDNGRKKEQLQNLLQIEAKKDEEVIDAEFLEYEE